MTNETLERQFGFGEITSTRAAFYLLEKEQV